jgi:predicted helicase
VRVMQEIKKTSLEHKYKQELHCNEVMLLPYYIASMNIEHEYFEATGSYEAFEGICFVDTFELAESKQASFAFMSPENTQRVERQKRSPITVIVGNPPYNASQVNENDNNKNRKYKVMDKRVSETYAKDSKAQLVNKLSDPYVKAIRWASDRIGEEGIIAFVTNNSFIDQIAFDGVRQHLEQDFDEIYVLDLGGNVRKNPKLSGTTHNVFSIQVGVSVNLFVRKKQRSDRAKIYYSRVDEFWRKEQKYKFLEENQYISNIDWQEIQPDAKQTWLTEDLQEDFDSFIAIGSPRAKKVFGKDTNVIFQLFSYGVLTARDAWVYNYSRENLLKNIESLIDRYSSELIAWEQKAKNADPREFLLNRDVQIKWTRRLFKAIKNHKTLEVDEMSFRNAIYRPYCKRQLYFNKILNEEVYSFPEVLPTPSTEEENKIIWLKVGSEWAMFALAINSIPDALPQGGSQSFPFYTYDEDGTNRKENITDWALNEFHSHYKDKSITKWDIFHYVYALLHHPFYRERYAANLKRELPRIPYAPDFRAFADAGKQLAELHVNYEQQQEYPLEMIESQEAALDWRVEKMRLSKDKTSIIYNDFLMLSGIPSEAFEYRLGNRSALDWIIDQYQVSTDKRSGITNDPNREDDPQYIVHLIGQIITVSLETMKIVHALPDLGINTD